MIQIVTTMANPILIDFDTVLISYIIWSNLVADEIW